MRMVNRDVAAQRPSAIKNRFERMLFFHPDIGNFCSCGIAMFKSRLRRGWYRGDNEQSGAVLQGFGTEAWGFPGGDQPGIQEPGFNLAS
jgi:hypothetical protein